MEPAARAATVSHCVEVRGRSWARAGSCRDAARYGAHGNGVRVRAPTLSTAKWDRRLLWRALRAWREEAVRLTSVQTILDQRGRRRGVRIVRASLKAWVDWMRERQADRKLQRVALLRSMQPYLLA